MDSDTRRVIEKEIKPFKSYVYARSGKETDIVIFETTSGFCIPIYMRKVHEQSNKEQRNTKSIAILASLLSA